MSTAHVVIRSISTQQKDVVTRRLPSGSPWFPRCEIERKQTRPAEIKTVSEVAKKEKHTSDGFVFSAYVRALKDAWTGTIADADLIELLYGLIARPLNLKGQTGQPISCSKKEASYIMNRKKEAHGEIRRHCRDTAVEDSIVEKFERSVLPRLNGCKFDLLRNELTTLVLDSDCSEAVKDELLTLADQENLAPFLARSLQLSLSWDNKLSERFEQEKDELPLPKIKGRIDPEVPEDIAECEPPYVDALVRVYGEEENAEFASADEIDEFPRYKDHLTRQRKDYYSAEFIRRCMRDTYDAEGDDQFEILEEEVFNGVIDIHGRKFDTGRQRLDEVLAQAANLNMDGVWVNRDTDWIRTYVKKGVCHILVNDKRIRGWLDEDR